MTRNEPFESVDVYCFVFVFVIELTKNGYSHKLASFIAKLLIVDPRARISAKQALNDSWFDDQYAQKIKKRDARHIFNMLRTYNATFKMQKIVMVYFV